MSPGTSLTWMCSKISTNAVGRRSAKLILRSSLYSMTPATPLPKSGTRFGLTMTWRTSFTIRTSTSHGTDALITSILIVTLIEAFLRVSQTSNTQLWLVSGHSPRTYVLSGWVVSMTSTKWTLSSPANGFIVLKATFQTNTLLNLIELLQPLGLMVKGKTLLCITGSAQPIQLSLMTTK